MEARFGAQLELSNRRFWVGAYALVWFSLTVFFTLWSEIGVLAVLIPMTTLPGLLLFIPAIRRPTDVNLAWRLVGSLTGLALIAWASLTVRGGACQGDGLCWTQILNGMLADLTLSGLLWAFKPTLARRLPAWR